MIPLVSDGGNHPPSAYADGCARTIFNIDPSIAIERGAAANSLLSKMIEVLIPRFEYVLKREKEHLASFVDQCDNDYHVREIALTALWELQALAVNTPWESKLMEADWQQSALNTVSSHLATAVHVERLLFADANPTNPSAVAYRARFHGAS